MSTEPCPHCEKSYAAGYTRCPHCERVRPKEKPPPREFTPRDMFLLLVAFLVAFAAGVVALLYLGVI